MMSNQYLLKATGFRDKIYTRTKYALIVSRQPRFWVNEDILSRGAIIESFRINNKLWRTFEVWGAFEFIPGSRICRCKNRIVRRPWGHYDRSNVTYNCDEHVKIPFKNYLGLPTLSLLIAPIANIYIEEYHGLHIFYL